MDQTLTVMGSDAPPATSDSWTRGWLAIALALLGLVAGGFVVWWVLRPPADSSAEVTFARDMIAHHGQAVEMALILRDRTADPDLRLFALDIVLTQQAQSGQMQGWLAVWGRTLAGAQPPMAGHGEMMGMASQGEVNSLHELPLAETEISFLELMIEHHLGGVAMARTLLATSHRTEVTRLADAIVQGQQAEVIYMRELLAKRNVEAPAASPKKEHTHTGG